MTKSDEIREIIRRVNKLMMRGDTYENSAKLRKLSNQQNKLIQEVAEGGERMSEKVKCEKCGREFEEHFSLMKEMHGKTLCDKCAMKEWEKIERAGLQEIAEEIQNDKYKTEREKKKENWEMEVLAGLHDQDPFRL